MATSRSKNVNPDRPGHWLKIYMTSGGTPRVARFYSADDAIAEQDRLRAQDVTRPKRLIKKITRGTGYDRA